MIFGLIAAEFGNRRKHPKSIGCQKNDFGCVASFGNWFYNIVNVVDRIRNACIFGFSLAVEIDRAIFPHHQVLQQCIALDGMKNVGFVFFAQVDALGVASSFKVEDAVG